MERLLRIGILGVGRITQRQIEAMIAAKNCQPFAIASRDPEKAEHVAMQYDLKVCQTYDELIKNDDIDIVYIGLPNHLHIPWAVKAMNTGKHVLVDKPLTHNFSDLVTLLNLKSSTGPYVMEGMMYRADPVIDKLVELIQNDTIGQIKYIDYEFCHDIVGYLNHEDNYRYYLNEGGGALLDLGIYIIDFFHLFLSKLEGREDTITTDLQPISSYMKFFDLRQMNGVDCAKVPADKTTSALFIYKSDTLEINCNLLCSFEFKRKVLWIGGSKGTIEVENLSSSKRKTMTVRNSSGIQKIELEELNTYQLMYDSFCQSILHDTRLLISLEESKKNLEMIEDILSSSRDL